MEQNYVLRPWTTEEEADFKEFCESLETKNSTGFEDDFETVDFLFDMELASC